MADFVLVAFLVVFGYFGAKKGFVKSLLGILSTLISAIISFFFEEVKVNRIESQHDPNNPNSGKVMLKCGLTYEGTLRQADWSNKGIVDACMYSFLASDYFQRR